MTRNKEIDLAKKWILDSGIQNTEGAAAGGFNSWFDMDQNGYSYVYSEITGYGITMLMYLGRRFADKECLTRAVLAAKWLISNASHPSGGVKTRDYYKETDESHLYSFESENIYTFDNGMVLYGMTNLYRYTEKPEHLAFAFRLADFLLKKMAKQDGQFFPTYNAKTGTPEEAPWKWSSQSGSYHAKLALGFTDLYDITKQKIYKEAVLALCERCMDFQDGSGRFITSSAEKSTHLHPHCYSAEGLLYAGLYFKKDEFIESAAQAVRWAIDNQQPDGGVPKKFTGETFIPYYRTDILAQVLRLGVMLHNIGKLDGEYTPRLEKLRGKLLDYQYAEEGDQAGGFFYGTALDGRKKDHLNSWCTMFALQALIMYEDLYVNGSKEKKWGCFV